MKHGSIGFNESTTPDKHYSTVEIDRNGRKEQVSKAFIVDEEGNPLDVAKDGTDATDVAPLAGGVGIRGFLSSIFKLLSDRLPSLTNGKIPVTLGSDNITVTGSINIPGDIEIKNDEGNPIPTDITRFAGGVVSPMGFRNRSREDFATFDKLFCAPINPTIGTAVPLGVAAQNAYAPLAPNIVLVAGEKPISLERLLLSVGVAGTALTSLRMAVRISKTNKYISGGTDLAPKTTLNHTPKTTGVNLKVGTVAIVAADQGTDTVLIYNGVIKPTIPVINDAISIDFGNDKITESNIGGKIAMKVPPVIIPAGGCVLINIWGPAQTAATTYEGMLFYTEE